MKKLLCLLLLISAILVPMAGITSEFTPHQLTLREKHFDFTQLINQINNQYGPLLYKRDHLGINLGELAAEYWDQMKNTETNGEFYSLIVKFIAEFKDGHFSAKIPTTLRARLPLDLSIVEEKVVIEGIDREILLEDQFPFNRGDEVVSMDGQSIMKLAEELKKYISSGNPRATNEMASWFLTFRSGKTFPVPQGKATLAIKPAGSDVPTTVELDWIIKGYTFDENHATPWQAMTLTMEKNPSTAPSETIEEKTDGDITNLSLFDLIPENRLNSENSYHCNGNTRTAIPEDATMLIEKPFVAYYHPTPKGNVGYLRIAHYNPEDDNHNEENWFGKYEWTLKKLEENTVGLIIDQDHNCGGSVSLMEDIVSLFMNEKFKPLPFQLRASKLGLLRVEGYMTNFDSEHYIQFEQLLDIHSLIMDSITKGLYLTPMTTFRGNDLVPPMNVYSKPVIVLTDYMSGSCGDAFPAMMQGLGRAKILGSKTWGLGGNVISMEPLFYSQIRTRMTQSLFFHPNGTAIENNGVTPDIPYEITHDDFMNAYRGYQQFYLNELMKMLP